MFTWNFQFISKGKLAELIDQLMLHAQPQDVLVRIHTSIHTPEEAVELAGFIKAKIPHAHILGTSTTAAICAGKLYANQCIVSLTQMTGGTVKTSRLPLFDKDGIPASPSDLCNTVKEAVIKDDSKLLLAFMTSAYRDAYEFAEETNRLIPGVQMTGGVVCSSPLIGNEKSRCGFVFDENGYSDCDVILASIGGSDVECCSAYITGAQAIGESAVITGSFGSSILSIEGKDAVSGYLVGIDEKFRDKAELRNLFPFVYSDSDDLPIFISYSADRSLSELYPEDDPANRKYYEDNPDIDIFSKTGIVSVNHNVRSGRKIRRSIIYDRNIINDNHKVFRKIESFPKSEVIFGYSDVVRIRIYSNCAKWELSAYENTNISGCITEGEFVSSDGVNRFGSGAFALTSVGEESSHQEFNPFAFSHTDSLAEDNKDLINYLTYMESRFENDRKTKIADSIKAFVRDCELKVLYSGNDEMGNAASMNIDIKIKGFDRVCMIKVADIDRMNLVFSAQAIELTHKVFISKCVAFARWKRYNVYKLEEWQIAFSAANYMVSLKEFVRDMEYLQKELFESSEENIAIVPLFCVMDGCTADNIYSAYQTAYIEMRRKNIQFYVKRHGIDDLDEESIRERYHMVNVINYAIAHDLVVPFFQGIYDNKLGTIHHYESLMRITDDKGTIYYPASFLDVARSYGLLYDTLSYTMIRKVFEIFKDSEGKSVSINLGMRDILNKGLTDYIFDFLSTVKNPENFIFEILENEDVGDYEVLMKFVDNIHQLGALISIDDFGSGFSNLKHIASIHSDFVKIDGSIIRNCWNDQESENLVALISGWKNLSLHKVSIIAEYVENDAIQEVMMRYNIDFSQGYLFSKPSPEINIDKE